MATAMHYTTLGSSDLKVSRIGFGCMSLGDDHKTNKQLLQKAFALGINFFDTADLYQKGDNEVCVGEALHHIRDQVIIATKVGNEWNMDGSSWRWNPKKEYILKAVNHSLKRLQTDYIDLYQLHGGTIDDPIEETIEAFELLKASGKIRQYGISSIRPNVIREYVKRSKIASVMMQYSLLDRRPEEEMLELLHRQQIGVLARGTLAKGLLAGKSPESYLNHKADDVAKAANAVGQLANDQRSASQMAIQYVLHHPAIASAIVGIRTESQLKEASATLDVHAATEEDIKNLAAAVPMYKYEQHR
jgi:aryl-alcohol dehydrogenase-like predicted oxidoreductase